MLEPLSDGWLFSPATLGILAVISLFLSYYFSSLEAVVGVLPPFKIKSLLTEQGAENWAVQQWLEHPLRLRGTLLIGRVGANVLVTLTSFAFVSARFGLSPLHFLLTLLFVSAIIVSVNFVIPSILRRQGAREMFKPMIPILKITHYLMFPLTYLVFETVIFFTNHHEENGQDATEEAEEEIRAIIDAGLEEGVLEKDDTQMLGNIFDFGETVVREIMTPRIDMTCLELQATFLEVRQIILSKGYSRIPVYEENIDHIEGVLHVKDLIKEWGKPEGQFKLERLLRRPYIIPENKNIKDLLAEFRREHTHIAIVVDEYGGTAGMVTLEDIIEEIVGEIEDEYDLPEEREVVPQENGAFLLSGKLNVDDLQELLGITIEESDFETLGGFLLHMTEHVPVVGEAIEHGGYRFTVQKADERRVIAVTAEPLTEQPGEGEPVAGVVSG